jgi:autotransporter translocation and assembly factor TamB
MTRWRSRWLLGGAIVAIVLVSGYLFRGPLLGFALVQGAHVAGYDVAYRSLDEGHGRLSIDHLQVTSIPGEPVLSADLVAVSYDLTKVFGSPHPFGITGVEIDRPTLTYIKHSDGTSNITLPASSASPAPSGPLQIPQLTFALRNGTIGISDDTRVFAHSRRILVKKIGIDANLDPAAISKITLALTLQDADGVFPVTGAGTLDPARGIELTKIVAKSIGLSALMDYALNSPSLHVAGGEIDNIDARIYGLRNHAGQMDRHVAVTADLDHFQPYLGGIVKPLRDGRGALRVYDRGLAIPKVDGSIAGIPVRIAGSIYNLSNPMLRLGVTGKGDLSKLVTLSDAAKKFPVSGSLAFKLFVEGAATSPMTLVTFSAPHMHYGAFPIDDVGGAIALHGEETAILRTSLAYDGIDVGARGVLILGKHTDTNIVANVSAPAQRVPYASDLLGAMPVVAFADVGGTDGKLETAGYLGGDTATTHLAGTFAVDGNGIGNIGPITLDGPGNRALYARVALDRPRGGGGAAYVSLSNFHVATGGKEPTLPGLRLGAVPKITGTLDGDIAAALDGKNVVAGGNVHAQHFEALGYPIDDVVADANVSTTTTHPANARVTGNVRYRGDLAPLALAAGGKIKATGSVDIPVSIAATGTSSLIAQIHGARFTDASVAGIALRSLDGTVGVRGKTIDVYGLQAGIGNGNVVARGSFGNGGTLAVSTSGIDLATLRSAGLPVTSGNIAALASIQGTAQSPRLSGGVAANDIGLANAQAAGIRVNASTGLSYADGTFGVSNAIVAAGPAIASLDGSVSGLRGRPQAAHYDFSADLKEADIATLAHIAHAEALYPEGTLDANVRVAGSGSAPGITGRVEIPEGSINGLRYRDASVALSGTPRDVHAQHGTITIGSSVLGFGASVAAGAQSFALHAPRVDLADFNDYFDPGDLLGGTGSIDAAVANAPDRLTTSGRVRIENTRVKGFTIGATRADWSTTGRTIHTDAVVGDRAGHVRAGGDVTLAASAPLRDALHRTSLALTTRASDVDLAVWLPAAGVQAPVLGLINANATLNGTYPNITANAHAQLDRGLVQRIAVRTATIDATAARGHATITRAVLAIDNLQASAMGSVALSPQGPFDLTIDAKTPDIAALAKTLTGKTIDASGSIATTARISGSPKQLSIADTTDAQNVRYQKYTLPRAHAQVAVVPGRVTVSNTEVDLQQGKVLIDGYAPLNANFAGIAPTQPVALNVAAQGIDLTQFSAFFPKNTKLTGALDGRVGLIGSLDNPGLSGQLSLVNGTFVGPQEMSKITDLNGQVAFANRTVTLQNTSAKVGGGTISANGSVSVPNLRDPANSASIAFEAVSNNAVFNLPDLFKGRINGNITLARAAGADYKVGGQVAVTSARISTTGLLPKGATPTSTATPLPVDLNLGVDVGNDVRVQGGPVDIGAKGDLQIAGTLAAPTADGTLTSTGGTVSFYRTFQLQYPSTVAFDPSDGVIPNIDATATTSIDNPQTDVTLHVTGPATQLNVDLQSDPSYDKQQILGLLVGVQALGAVSGVASSNQTGAQANPFTALAQGQLGTLLTQNVLEPFSSQLGSAVGLSNLEVNYQPGGSLGLGAQKQIAKNINAVFAESFNEPIRETIGLRATPKPTTAYQFTFFSQPDNNRLQTFQASDFISSNDSVTASQPASGTSGISASILRRFH